MEHPENTQTFTISSPETSTNTGESITILSTSAAITASTVAQVSTSKLHRRGRKPGSKDRKPRFRMSSKRSQAITKIDNGPAILEKLPGGDVAVRLILRERHAIACAAEAENQVKPLSLWLQEWFEFGLESEWGM